MMNQEEFMEWSKTTPFIFDPPATDQVNLVQGKRNAKIAKRNAVLNSNDRG
jgi:hypothetical protein